jgi:hypothetical protein
LLQLLQTAEFDIKKEAAWAISNATSGGSHEQIKYTPLTYCTTFWLVEFCAMQLMYVCFEHNLELVLSLPRYLVAEGCIKPLCDLLVCPDPRIVTVCLEGLENILKVGEHDKTMGGATADGNLFAQMIDEAEGLEKIENLQSHDNNEIYEKAVKLLEAYWMEEEDDAMATAGEAAPAVFDFSQGGNPAAGGGLNFN